MSEDNNNQAAAPEAQGARPWNPLDEWKLRLLGDVLKGAVKPATWKLSMIANQLRVQVFTNVGEDRAIEAKMDSWSMYTFFECIRRTVADPNLAEPFRIQCYTGPEAEMRLESTILVGRDSEKRIFLGIADANDENRRARFTLLPTGYHHLVDASGKKRDAVMVSELWASGYVNLMETLCACTLASHGADRRGKDIEGEVRPPRQWNNNQSGGGGYQKKFQGNGGNGGGNWPKKQWNNNGGGNGGGGGNWPKKQWNNNGNGGGGGNYPKKQWGNNQNSYRNEKTEQGFSGDLGVSSDSEAFDDTLSF